MAPLVITLYSATLPLSGPSRSPAEQRDEEDVRDDAIKEGYQRVDQWPAGGLRAARIFAIQDRFVGEGVRLRHKRQS